MSLERLPIEINEVGAEIERQAERDIELGFHKELGMSEGRFKDSIMELVTPQPETFRGRFDIPVVAFGQIPAGNQLKAAGIEVHFDLEYAHIWDWNYNPNDWLEEAPNNPPKPYQTPNNTYLTWMQDGKVNIGKTVDGTRVALAADERGATFFDGLALHLAKPQLLINHNIYLPGTSIHSVANVLGIARLVGWDGEPKPSIGAMYAFIAKRNWGSATCGRV